MRRLLLDAYTLASPRSTMTRFDELRIEKPRESRHDCGKREFGGCRRRSDHINPSFLRVDLNLQLT